jgi:hypothetical protein
MEILLLSSWFGEVADLDELKGGEADLRRTLMHSVEDLIAFSCFGAYSAQHSSLQALISFRNSKNPDGFGRSHIGLLLLRV